VKTVLVTGGAGFIGSNFIKYYLDNFPEDKIVNLDNLTYAGNLNNLQDIEANPNYQFLKGDICDKSLVDSTFATGIDLVVNFAAESHVDRSITGPEIFVDTNIGGIQVLLEAARKYWTNTSNKLFLQVSTDEVYGTLGKTGYFTEETPLAPNSPYSASKAGSDLLARSYFHTFDLPVIITRCSNNYGPYQFPEKLIPLIINNALHDKELPVYGDGKNVRDWLYVEDHCSAISTVIQKGNIGEVYNIGGNNEKENIAIIELILDHLEKPHSLIKYVKDRPGHDRRYAIDASKMKNELGWEPAYRFENGIKQTIDWYLNNQQWLKDVISGDYQKYYELQYK